MDDNLNRIFRNTFFNSEEGRVCFTVMLERSGLFQEFVTYVPEGAVRHNDQDNNYMLGQRDYVLDILRDMGIVGGDVNNSYKKICDALATIVPEKIEPVKGKDTILDEEPI